MSKTSNKNYQIQNIIQINNKKKGNSENKQLVYYLIPTQQTSLL